MIEHILPSRGGNSYVFHHYTVEKETLARFRPLSAAEKSQATGSIAVRKDKE
jgi:hypothetical protein